MFSTIVLITLLIISLIVYACIKVSGECSKTEDKIFISKGELHERLSEKIRDISTYFFDDKNKLSFEKFCDYILCIRDSENKTKYLEYLAELELLISCCPDLESTMFSILVEDRAIVIISGASDNFEILKQCIKDKKFKGTYGDFCYILFTTIFYLKNKIGAHEHI